MNVLYTCDACGIKDRAVEVPMRTDDQKIGAWMYYVASMISDDHTKASPDCLATTMTNAKIPLPESARYIGDEERH